MSIEKATDKQISYLFWRIEALAIKPAGKYQVKTTDGKITEVNEQKSLTMEKIYNEFPAENKREYFYDKMQNASAAQASYLIKLISSFKYQKVVEILRQLKVIN